MYPCFISYLSIIERSFAAGTPGSTGLKSMGELSFDLTGQMEEIFENEKDFEVEVGMKSAGEGEKEKKKCAVEQSASPKLR